MKARLLAVLTVSALCGACGDEGGGGCGEAPQKEAPAAAGAPAGDHRGSGGGAAPLLITTQKGTRKVPEEYQRATQGAGPSSASDAPAKSTAPAQPPASRPGLAAVRVVRRGVDGVAGRAELLCRVVASSPDGTCAASPDRDKIRRTCCPKGVIERCRVGLRGVELVGRGCVPDEAPASP